jgi:hypothetical protein|tara:strand:- start:5787 stop:6035 length:249 start_codon:yes stop_codon:yes gene_type:complete
MKNTELINYIIDKFDGVILDDYDREIHRIEGKSYDITFDRSRVEWSCSCPAFKFRRRHKISKCKHIKEIQMKKFNHMRGNNG